MASGNITGNITGGMRKARQPAARSDNTTTSTWLFSQFSMHENKTTIGNGLILSRDRETPDGYKWLSKAQKRKIRKGIQKYKRSGSREQSSLRECLLHPKAFIDESTLDFTHTVARARALLPQHHRRQCVGTRHLFLCGCVIRVLCDSCADAWDSKVPTNCTLCPRPAGQYERQHIYCPLQHYLSRADIRPESIAHCTPRYKAVSGLRIGRGNFREFYLLSLLDNQGCLWVFRGSLWGQLAKWNDKSTWFLLERVDEWTPKILRYNPVRKS